MFAKSNITAYVCVGSALLLCLAITGWGAYLDFHEVRQAVLEGEVNRIRSHGVRTVARIQERLNAGDKLADALHGDSWLRDYWERWIANDPKRAYAAVVDGSGNILIHSNRTLEGGRLSSGWYRRAMTELDRNNDPLADDPTPSRDVVETSHLPLTGGQTAIDISIPIMQQDREIATYHTALNWASIARILEEKNVTTRNRWTGIFAVMLVLVSVSAVSLHRIGRRKVPLHEALAISQVHRFAELGELAADIADQIHTPIDAIRRSLQVVQRSLPQDDSQSHAAVMEAGRALDRAEGLIKDMLCYARPDAPKVEDLDIRAELGAVLQFIQPVMTRERIDVTSHFPAAPVYARFDRNRFRQTVLNLINNAKTGVGPSGRIEVRLDQGRHGVELTVSDDGRTTTASARHHVWGLEWALVKRFVEEAGGSVSRESDEHVGDRVCIRLPAVSRESRQNHLLGV